MHLLCVKDERFCQLEKICVSYGNLQGHGSGDTEKTGVVLGLCEHCRSHDFGIQYSIFNKSNVCNFDRKTLRVYLSLKAISDRHCTIAY